jgi:hypothetical protein
MERVMAKPMRLPCGLLVKNAKKYPIHLLHWQPNTLVADRELELTVLQFRLHHKLSD